MARVTAARRVALQVLGEARRREAYVRDLLRTSKRVATLDERDRSFATRLALGVTATQGLLDQRIDKRLTRKHLQPKVRDALRMGTYELLFCSTPASAAVNQAVELVRMETPRATGLANAVLHRIAEEDTDLRKQACTRVSAGDCSVNDLVLVSGYPAWLLEQVMCDHGLPAAISFACAALEPAPVYVAANRARVSDDEAFALLQTAGVAPSLTDVEGAYVLERPAGLASSGLVEQACVVVADLSAQRVARLSTPIHDASVLEVGQGRGTKSMLMQNVAREHEVHITQMGIDSLAYKVDVSRKRMEQAGLANAVSCCVFDACKLGEPTLPKELDRAFDTVFVDAPCSGTGTLRRHPEIAWSCTKQDVEELAQLQLRILCASSARVAPGGYLCYATCSVLSRENDGVVRAFLKSAEGAPFSLEGAALQTLPVPQGPDGHFCVRLHRA